MIIQQALLSAVKKMQRTKSDSPHLDAEVLLAFVVRRNRAYVLSHHDRTLTARQAKKFMANVSRRLTGLPIAYLTGQKEFYGLNFFVDKNVLVPRPETELLVETALRAARHLPTTNGRAPSVIADIGTGSGCIAITLSKYLPSAKLMAVDISEKALAVAQKNARLHKAISKITFIKGDLLRPLILKKNKCDMLVANLPYLTNAEIKNVKHEPKTALYGGKMGVEPIERLLMQSTEVLNDSGIILLEISPTQVKVVDYLAEKHLPGKRVTFIKDLSGRDRVVQIG